MIILRQKSCDTKFRRYTSILTYPLCGFKKLYYFSVEKMGGNLDEFIYRVNSRITKLKRMRISARVCIEQKGIY